MAVVENVRSNPAAVLSIRGLLGCDEESASDIVETVRPHLENPLHMALAGAMRENVELKARIKELEAEKE